MSELETYVNWIGSKVSKTGLKKGRTTKPKPFKSRFLVNTVKGVITNPNTGKLALSFIEHDSVVDCYICRQVTEN